MDHSVLDYSTIRWLQKHHNNRKISVQDLRRDNVIQLREMFDHLDEDGSGTIEIDELKSAMASLGGQVDYSHVLEQFSCIDTDGSGSIDFDEFLAVMTSDMVDQHFFQLSDEQEAQKYNMQFFSFATAYRRKKLHEKIQDKATDANAYQSFHNLFTVPNMPSGVASNYEANYDTMKKTYQMTRKTLATSQIRRNAANVLQRNRLAAQRLCQSQVSNNKRTTNGERKAREDLRNLLGQDWVIEEDEEEYLVESMARTDQNTPWF